MKPHAVDQAQKREVYPENIKKALESKDTLPGNKGNRTVFIRKGLHVYFDNDIDEVVTVIYKGKKG